MQNMVRWELVMSFTESEVELGPVTRSNAVHNVFGRQTSKVNLGEHLRKGCRCLSSPFLIGRRSSSGSSRRGWRAANVSHLKYWSRHGRAGRLLAPQRNCQYSRVATARYEQRKQPRVILEYSHKLKSRIGQFDFA